MAAMAASCSTKAYTNAVKKAFRMAVVSEINEDKYLLICMREHH
jgi:hypothetical protein